MGHPSLVVGRFHMSLLFAMALAAATTVSAQSDGMVAPLTNVAGNAASGRAIVANRQQSLCLLCHSGPFADAHLQGNMASNLTGAGSRWTAGQLRLRIVDAKQLDPNSIMPAMHKLEGLQNVSRAWRDKPVLDAQQVEDVVAFLLTLRD